VLRIRKQCCNPCVVSKMTKCKLCGLSTMEAIQAANACKPQYIGFVFATKSKRYVSPKVAAALKAALSQEIQAVGVFVNEPIESVINLLQEGIIDVAQLHGSEEDAYVEALKAETKGTIIQAFRIHNEADIQSANDSKADLILVDSVVAGSGQVFDWELLQGIKRPYLLAGGLTLSNVAEAVEKLHPYGVDVSSGIETEGKKDPDKMRSFVNLVIEADRRKRND